MNKIAILMLVHKNEDQINRLINHLSRDFDLYIHVDKCSKINIKTKNNIYIYKKYKAYWGSFNLILASLYLFKKAFEHGYNRYILISGQDMPIVSNEEIISFFENNDYEYLDIESMPRIRDPKPTIDRILKYHIVYDRGKKTHYKKEIKYFLEKNILPILEKFIPRNFPYEFYGGELWTNLTHTCVDRIFSYLLKDKKYINRYKWTYCTDEIFYQTIIHQIKDLKIINNCLRYIDWRYINPDRPKIIRIDDYDTIMQTKNIFARKFDETIDHEIINKIYEKIGES